MKFLLRNMSPMFDQNQVIFYEGKLYERLPKVKGGPKHKYRVILASHDYDYVTVPALRKRLDRAFKSEGL